MAKPNRRRKGAVNRLRKKGGGLPSTGRPVVKKEDAGIVPVSSRRNSACAWVDGRWVGIR